MSSPLRVLSDHLHLRVKAVPGASRDAISGLLGDRLKIKVAAPPEGGKANHAICGVVARALGLRPRQVSVLSGHASAEKTLLVEGWTRGREAAAEALGIPEPE